MVLSDLIAQLSNDASATEALLALPHHLLGAVAHWARAGRSMQVRTFHPPECGGQEPLAPI